MIDPYLSGQIKPQCVYATGIIPILPRLPLINKALLRLQTILDMGHVVRLELALDLEGVAKCGEEMNHAIVAAVIGTRANVPLALGRRSLLKIY